MKLHKITNIHRIKFAPEGVKIKKNKKNFLKQMWYKTLENIFSLQREAATERGSISLQNLHTKTHSWEAKGNYPKRHMNKCGIKLWPDQCVQRSTLAQECRRCRCMRVGNIFQTVRDQGSQSQTHWKGNWTKIRVTRYISKYNRKSRDNLATAWQCWGLWL